MKNKRQLFALILMVIICGSLLTPTYAHVTNSNNIYDDIEFSPAKEAIVELRALNIIPYEGGSGLFKPQNKLTRSDLAFWAGSLTAPDATQMERNELEQFILNQGQLQTLEGNATLEDIISVYWKGNLPVSEELDQEFTREQFSSWMLEHIHTVVDGASLFERIGVTQGPSGIIEKVESETVTEEQSKYHIYYIYVDGQRYPLNNHPKIIGGSTDLTIWEGKELEESWLDPESEEPKLSFLKLKEGEMSLSEIASETDQQHQQMDKEAAPATSQDASFWSKINTGHIIIAAALIVLVGLIAWLFSGKKINRSL